MKRIDGVCGRFADAMRPHPSASFFVESMRFSGGPEGVCGRCGRNYSGTSFSYTRVRALLDKYRPHRPQWSKTPGFMRFLVRTHPSAERPQSVRIRPHLKESAK
jgi:hypothetical protein